MSEPHTYIYLKGFQKNKPKKYAVVDKLGGGWSLICETNWYVHALYRAWDSWRYTGSDTRVIANPMRTKTPLHE